MNFLRMSVKKYSLFSGQKAKTFPTFPTFPLLTNATLAEMRHSMRPEFGSPIGPRGRRQPHDRGRPWRVHCRHGGRRAGTELPISADRASISTPHHCNVLLHIYSGGFVSMRRASPRYSSTFNSTSTAPRPSPESDSRPAASRSTRPFRTMAATVAPVTREAFRQSSPVSMQNNRMHSGRVRSAATLSGFRVAAPRPPCDGPSSTTKSSPAWGCR